MRYSYASTGARGADPGRMAGYNRRRIALNQSNQALAAGGPSALAGGYRRRRGTQQQAGPQMPTPAGVLAQYQQAFDQATARNLALESELDQGYLGRYRRGVADYGGQRIRDINESYSNAQSQLHGSLINRGLTGSNIGQAPSAMIERERQGALDRATDVIADRDARLSGDHLAARERTNYGYPEQGQLLQLMQMYGASGYGQSRLAGNPQAFAPVYQSLGQFGYRQPQYGAVGTQMLNTPRPSMSRLAAVREAMAPAGRRPARRRPAVRPGAVWRPPAAAAGAGGRIGGTIDWRL